MKGIEYVHVSVKHNPHVTIPVFVPAYEVPVLEGIHNSQPDAPTVLTHGDPEVIEREFEPQLAFDDLLRKYQANQGIVRYVYRDAADLNRRVNVIDIPKRKRKDSDENAEVA